MHTYRREKNGDTTLWVVGYYTPVGVEPSEWVALRDFNNLNEAAAFVNYLNGGDGDVLYSK